LRPSSEAVRAKQEKYLRAVAAVAGVIGGLVLMAAIPGLGVLLGLGTMGAAVVFGLGPGEIPGGPAGVVERDTALGERCRKRTLRCLPA
jgi:hypothetical protein